MVILCSYKGIIKLGIITVNWLIKVKRNYLRNYLINEVRNLEKFLSEENSWGERPDLILILTKLLINGKEIIFDGSIIKDIEKRVLYTPFHTLDDLEKYTHGFIKQTQLFASGEVGSRPRIIVEDEDRYRMKEVETHYFLKAQTDGELLTALERIYSVATRLDEHLMQATNARRQILLSLLKPTLQPMLVTLEQIYEVLNHETDKA